MDGQAGDVGGAGGPRQVSTLQHHTFPQTFPPDRASLHHNARHTPAFPPIFDPSPRRQLRSLLSIFPLLPPLRSSTLLPSPSLSAAVRSQSGSTPPQTFLHSDPPGPSWLTASFILWRELYLLARQALSCGASFTSGAILPGKPSPF